MKRKKVRAAGARGKAPLPGKRIADMSSLLRVEKNQAAMDEIVLSCRMADPRSRTRDAYSQAISSSVDFQARRLANSLISAGREAAPEVGLEICAAAIRPRELHS
jgi:hypothetical protein